MTIHRYFIPTVLLLACGCGQDGPRTYPVGGRVELKGGDVTHLAGSAVEVSLASDRTARAYGQIEPDGRFRLESLQAGEVRRGVPEGNYVARILPNDEDGPSRQRATRALSPRYLRFETSGLTLQVPTNEDVTLRVAARRGER
jgi:hypothetical protein